MTELRQTASDRGTDSGPNAPRAIIHKQILEAAEQRPDASMETIADGVSGATVTTVERVLEEYGDPGSDAADEVGVADDSETTPNATEMSNESTTPATVEEELQSESESDSKSEPVLDRTALTEKQAETLRAIAERPDATQAELADTLGVSSPTISQRVNSIEGFDWSNRHELVEPLFGNGDESVRQPAEATQGGNSSGDQHSADPEDGDTDRATESETDSQNDGSVETQPAACARQREDGQAAEDEADGGQESGDDRRAELEDRIDELTAQVRTLQDEVEALQGRETATESVLDDPELAHKVVHACLHSDRITEEEELQLLRDVTAAGSAEQAGTESSFEG
ncbi:winged helix-turn-helix transcriptional regulator [Natronorubrum sp. JWXQ-INN-674]|uniref:Winged helix-turn-helix transcriptional regulator n=1 Tax=Natronorubrum halalkaliphilum TaxID=2691917 RepID=A0A6B0VM28_9EURY|nr:winged helix-turn-helix transcriptional regulator [Natronorubrum halalkaliphilum]MXV61822.1 winged helix-turn-helix transcriptional regulator [Natronorubrum halalkaliphilum]